MLYYIYYFKMNFFTCFSFKVKMTALPLQSKGFPSLKFIEILTISYRAFVFNSIDY